MDWGNTFRGSLTVLLLGLTAAYVVEETIGEKKNKRERLIGWCIAMLAIVLSRFGLDQAEVLISSYLFSDLADRGITGIIYTTVDNSIGFLIPPIFVMIYSIITYDISRSVKIFVSTFAGFWVFLVHEYPFELLRIPFLGKDRGDGLRSRPDFWVNTLLFLLCLIIFGFMYKKYLCPQIKKIINLTNGNMKSFVFLPLVCSAVFMSLMSILQGNGVEATSIYSNEMWMYILVVGVLVFLFITLYWSLFRGLTLSTQAMCTKAELDVARNIQLTILPSVFPAFPDRKEFDIYTSIIPAKEVGGDFYDFFLVDSDHLAFCIADVSGKSVPAALYMMNARTLIQSLMLSGETPESTLTIANNRLCINNEAGMFVTVWLGLYEISSGKLDFANAGHNPPLLFHNGKWEYMDHKIWKRSIMLGLREGITYKNNQMKMEMGDCLLLYTDGVTEAADKNNELFGESRLKACVEEMPVNSINTCEMVDRVLRGVDDYVRDEEQFDDITVLAFQVKESFK